MNIFFTASLHGKQEHGDRYHRIVELVEEAGHDISADHILGDVEELRKEWKSKKKADFNDWVMVQMKQADAVFAEVSNNSTSVGYLLALAVQANKPVVIFYSGEQEPHLLKTLEESNDRLAVIRYREIKDLDREVPLMLDFAGASQDIRFNFFITPTLSHYLTWVSKQRKIPRSVYLRRLIDESMNKSGYLG